MKTLVSYALLFYMIGISSFTLAQPKIKFKSTTFDFGTVKEANRLYATYTVTNIGTEPLIIQNVQSGWGGLSGDWPKAPILPKKSATITLVYDGRTIGPINRTVDVSSNAINQPRVTLSVKGNIVERRTTIEMSSKQVNVGSIAFGAVDTISFMVINTGTSYSYFQFILNGKDAPVDLFSYYQTYHRFVGSEKDLVDISTWSSDNINPKDTIRIQICLRNVFGNVGKKERHFYFKYNKNDTLKFTIKANYIGTPSQQKIYESNGYQDNSLYEYENGQLIKYSAFTWGTILKRIYHFKNGNLIHTILIDPYTKKRTEYYFENSKEIENVKSINDKVD